MKRTVNPTIFLIACIIFYYSIAYATIVGSGHDLTAGGPGRFIGSSNEVCIYCHTPHNSVSQDQYGNRVALWNRSLNEGSTFTMYSSATFTATISAKPTGNSLLCLSCHDGISTLNGVLNYSDAPITMILDTPDQIGDLTYPPYANINIGRDLSNDHPVSFVYDDALVARDPGLKSPTLANLGALRLYYGRLECGTCHDPHEYGSPDKVPFLRMSNAFSAMCFQCHNK